MPFLDFHALRETRERLGVGPERTVDEAEVVVRRRDADLVAAFLAEREAAPVAEDRVLVLAAVPVDRSHEVVRLRDLGGTLLLVEDAVHEEAVLPRAVERAEPVVYPRLVVVELGPLLREQLVAVRFERLLEDPFRREKVAPLLENLALPAGGLDGEIAETRGLPLASDLFPAAPEEALREIGVSREGEVRAELEEKVVAHVGGEIEIEALLEIALVKAFQRGEPLAPHEDLQDLAAAERRLRARGAPREMHVGVDRRHAAPSLEEPRYVPVDRFPPLGAERRDRGGDDRRARHAVLHREGSVRERRRAGAGANEPPGLEAEKSLENALLLGSVHGEDEGERRLEGEHGEKHEQRPLLRGEGFDEAAISPVRRLSGRIELRDAVEALEGKRGFRRVIDLARASRPDPVEQAPAFGRRERRKLDFPDADAAAGELVADGLRERRRETVAGGRDGEAAALGRVAEIVHHVAFEERLVRTVVDEREIGAVDGLFFGKILEDRLVAGDRTAAVSPFLDEDPLEILEKMGFPAPLAPLRMTSARSSSRALRAICFTARTAEEGGCARTIRAGKIRSGERLDPAKAMRASIAARYSRPGVSGPSDRRASAALFARSAASRSKCRAAAERRSAAARRSSYGVSAFASGAPERRHASTSPGSRYAVGRTPGASAARYIDSRERFEKAHPAAKRSTRYERRERVWASAFAGFKRDRAFLIGTRST